MRALPFLLFSIWLQKSWRFLLDLLWDEGMSFVDWIRHLAAIKAKGLFLFSLPRSGSTLRQRVIATYPEVATSSELWLLLPCRLRRYL